ncbi:hypothetical protein OAP17_02235 [Porticoccaceae bacterium]|jgi:hypothetical protein|nr:hypothetical protein [Porticoccaceae bacterium]
MKNLLPLKEALPYETLYTYRFYKENGVSLERSRPIKKGVVRKIGAPETGRDSEIGVRVGQYGALPKGIQYYRMWFRFLKLALELEQKQIEVVITPNSYASPPVADRPNKDIKTYHIPREIKVLSVSKDFYKDWDLDLVLAQTFDKWWKTHHHIFEASLPEIITNKTIKTDDDHIYLKLDKTFNWEDLIPILSKEVRPKLNQPLKYQVKGKGRSFQLINRYNALVCCMQGMSPKEIFTDRAGYIRAPDEKGDRVDVGGSLTVTEDKVTGNLKYSGAFRRQYKGGIFHLLEVCEGRFGKGY